jgi:hypothetical protein
MKVVGGKFGKESGISMRGKGEIQKSIGVRISKSYYTYIYVNLIVNPILLCN